MRFSWLRRNLAAPVFEGDDYKTRVAALLNLLLLACLAVALVVGVIAFLTFSQPGIILLAAGLVFLWALVALVAMRRSHVRAASVLVVAGFWIFSTILVFLSDGVNGVFAMNYATLTVMAGLLLGRRVAIAVAELCALAGLVMVYAQMRGFFATPILVPAVDLAWLNLTVNLVLAVALGRLAIQSIGAVLDRSRRSAAELQLQRELLEKIVAERTRDLERRVLQLRMAAEVGRAAASILELGTLAHQVVELVRERFDLYYAGLFLLDDVGENAVLVAGSGEAGRIMEERSHKLSVGGMSMVGAACARRQACIVLDVAAEPRRFDNPLLPKTRSEIALPLMVADRVLGALDVQSTQQAAFSEDSIAVLQLVADQVAVAVDNARRFSTEAELLEAASPLFRVSRRLVSAVTMEEIVQAIVTSVAETEADGCVVGRLTDVVRPRRPSVGQGGTERGEGAAATSPTPVQDVSLLGSWNRHDASDVPVYLSGTASPLPVEMQSSFLVMEDITQDPRAAESLRSFLGGLGQAGRTDSDGWRVRQLGRTDDDGWRVRQLGRTDGDGHGATPTDRSAPPAPPTVGGVVNVPLRVAGQPVGFVTVYRAGAGPFSPVSMRLYETLADQAAVAMERQRLLDEAQSRADRERLISQVTGRMRQSLDVRRVLETAADEIYQEFGLEKVVIRLALAAPDPEGEAPGYSGTPGGGHGVPAAPVHPPAWSASSAGETSGNDGNAGENSGGTGEILR